MDVYSEISSFLKSQKVTLVAVSKTKPVELIQEFYNKGQLIFGENRVNELVEKHDNLPKDIKWHMIGHLQKNKVKYIAPFVDLIHSVDSFELAKTIDKEAKKNNRKIDVLLQIKVAKEETKKGFDYNQLTQQVKELMSLESINIIGLMGMGTFTDNSRITEIEFDQMRLYFDNIKSTFFGDNSDFKQLSMGMSGDYKIAVEKGSTMVRIGSLLFGKR